MNQQQTAQRGTRPLVRAALNVLRQLDRMSTDVKDLEGHDALTSVVKQCRRMNIDITPGDGKESPIVQLVQRCHPAISDTSYGKDSGFLYLWTEGSNDPLPIPLTLFDPAIQAAHELWNTDEFPMIRSDLRLVSDQGVTL